MTTLTRRRARCLRGILRRSTLGIARKGPIATLVLEADGRQLCVRYRYGGVAVEHVAPCPPNWAALCRYPEHGGLSIDNNLAERMLRAQALGRRNWTFLGSDRGGRTAAVLYSMTCSCKHHDIDPFAYLQDVLRRLPSHLAEELDELLPDVWFASHPSARRKTAA
jgi:hypothetical protein